MPFWKLIFKKISFIIIIFLIIFNSSLVLSANTEETITDSDLEGLKASKSQIEEILDFFSESIINDKPIDPDAAALQFGYKNFEEFGKQYLKIFELTDISIIEIREFLSGTDMYNYSLEQIIEYQADFTSHES